MSRILVPVDFSPSSANALKYAHQLSETLGMSLSLFYCFHPQTYNRLYDFGKKDYAQGVKEMLREFYKKYTNGKIGQTHFIAQAGTIISKVVGLSSKYKLVVLGGQNYKSQFHWFLGDRTSNIASLAKCPVMIITPDTSFSIWNNMWHVNRKDNETIIIKKAAKTLNLDINKIQTKNFEQTKFKSPFWKLVTSAFISHKKPVNQAIQNALDQEQVDVIILVSHQKDAFLKFVHNPDIQMMFENHIPILIFQE